MEDDGSADPGPVEDVSEPDETDEFTDDTDDFTGFPDTDEEASPAGPETDEIDDSSVDDLASDEAAPDSEEPRAEEPESEQPATQESGALVSSTGRSSGPPGTAVELVGANYPVDCEKVYVFFDGTRIGTAEPKGGKVAKSGLSVPGDADEGSHQVTTSCRASGTPIVSSGEFVVTEADLHRTAFTTSMPKPEQVDFSLGQILLSAAGALGLLALIAFPAELFNTTLEHHYDEVRGWFRLPPRDPSAATGVRHRLVFFSFLALSGPLWFAMQESSAFDVSTGVAALGLSLATGVVVVASDLPTFTYLRRHFGERATVVALPGSLLVAVACVALSRAVEFEPGYFYGLIGGLAFARRLRDDTSGRLATTSAGILLGLSIVSWVALGPVSDAAAEPGAGLWELLGENFLAGIFWVALDSLIIALLPLRLLTGREILRWSRKAWAVTYGFALFAFVHILLRPSTGYVADTRESPTVIVVGLFILFGLASLAFWAYFEFRKRPSEPSLRAPVGAA